MHPLWVSVCALDPPLWTGTINDRLRSWARPVDLEPKGAQFQRPGLVGGHEIYLVGGGGEKNLP